MSRAFKQGDPRQPVQYCLKCSQPTERCEEDTIYVFDDGPFYESCANEIEQVAQEEYYRNMGH